MAIPVINSQGMIMYIVSPSLGITPPTAALIMAGDVVGCPQSVGNLDQTRTVTEYKCMSSDESAKALGSIQRGNIEIGLLFDPEDAAGQLALKTAFADNAEITIGIELPDVGGTGTGGNGTIFAFNASISGVSIGIVQDEAVTYTVTAEIASEITEIEEVDHV